MLSAILRNFIFALLPCLISGCYELVEHPVQYPSGWPVPQLTAPSGALQDMLPDYTANLDMPPADNAGQDIRYLMSSRQLDANTPKEHRDWALAFKTTEGWDKVVKHVDDCLRPLGYRLVDRYGPKPYRSIYYDPTWHNEVALIYSQDTYCIRIEVHSTPLEADSPFRATAKPIL